VSRVAGPCIFGGRILADLLGTGFGGDSTPSNAPRVLEAPKAKGHSTRVDLVSLA